MPPSPKPLEMVEEGKVATRAYHVAFPPLCHYKVHAKPITPNSGVDFYCIILVILEIKCKYFLYHNKRISMNFSLPFDLIFTLLVVYFVRWVVMCDF